MGLLNEIRECKLCEFCVNGIPTLPDATGQHKVLIFGEAPGEQESIEGKPFVGRSGKLLRNILRDIGVQREEYAIDNIVKHRPPNNRTPTEAEADFCGDIFVDNVITLVNPSKIVCVGRTPAQFFLRRLALKPKGSLRGTVFEYRNIPVYNTWHPAYILRDVKKLPELVQDLKTIFEK